MAHSFHDAARRHRSDAKSLAANRRFQNAGHLIGFAAECLAKEILEASGIIIDRQSGLKEHFPKLTQKIRMLGQARGMIVLSPIIASSSFLDRWQADGRYEAHLPERDAEILYNSWATDADLLFSAAGIQ